MISRFRGEYYFLSNFYRCDIMYKEHLFACAEGAFQWAKARYPEEELEKFLRTDGPHAKKRGRMIKMRHDWQEVKDNIMMEIVFAKFLQNPDLAEMLIRTGDAEIVEGHVNDSYWGVNKFGYGQNKLGKILMYVRSEFQEALKKKVKEDLRRIL